MYICSIDALKDPKLIQLARTGLNGDPSYLYSNQIFIHYPTLVTEVGGTSFNGVLSLKLPWKLRIDQGFAQIGYRNIASISFQSFTQNCGIRAIMGNSLPHEYRALLGKLWFEIFEAYAYYLKYSMLVGSTGTSAAGSHQINLVQEYGKGWVTTQPGINRRVGDDDRLWLYHKYLTPPTLEVPWGSPITDAQQITES